MRYFKFTYNNGVHTGAEDEYVEFDDNVTEQELNDYGQESLNNYAEDYSYLVLGWDNEYADEEEEDDEDAESYYYENCYYSFKEITKEEYMENCEE